MSCGHRTDRTDRTGRRTRTDRTGGQFWSEGKTGLHYNFLAPLFPSDRQTGQKGQKRQGKAKWDKADRKERTKRKQTILQYHSALYLPTVIVILVCNSVLCLNLTSTISLLFSPSETRPDGTDRDRDPFSHGSYACTWDATSVFFLITMLCACCSLVPSSGSLHDTSSGHACLPVLYIQYDSVMLFMWTWKTGANRNGQDDDDDDELGDRRTDGNWFLKKENASPAYTAIYPLPQTAAAHAWQHLFVALVFIHVFAA